MADKLLGTIGDVDPITHGGGQIIEDGDGCVRLYHYSGDYASGGIYIHIVCVEPDVCEDLNWMTRDDWSALASYSGAELWEIQEACVGNPVERAQLYAVVASYYGWDNLDSSPIKVTLAKAEEMRERLAG
jgi:hypothetical protein